MERQLTLEGGLTVCNLGPLRPSGDDQAVACSLRLEGVRPERRVAVCVSAAELSPDGEEHPRGTQMLTVPPHHGPEPADILLSGISFLLPEDLDVGDGEPRRVTLRAQAHYVDANARCLLPEA